MFVLVKSPFSAAVVLGNSCYDFESGKVKGDLLEKVTATEHTRPQMFKFYNAGVWFQQSHHTDILQTSERLYWNLHFGTFLLSPGDLLEPEMTDYIFTPRSSSALQLL